MILLRVTLEIPPGERRNVVATLREMIQNSRAETGCLYYNFSADLDSDARFHLTEEWESEAAFRAHLETPHFTNFLAALETVGAKRTTLARSGELAPYRLARPTEKQ